MARRPRFKRRLTSGGLPLSDETIAFTLNGSGVGSATTDTYGIATLSGVSLAGIHASPTPYADAVGASFAGDASHTASSGTAALTVNPSPVTITWNPASPIPYGTALGSAHLNAEGLVPRGGRLRAPSSTRQVPARSFPSAPKPCHRRSPPTTRPTSCRPSRRRSSSWSADHRPSPGRGAQGTAFGTPRQLESQPCSDVVGSRHHRRQPGGHRLRNAHLVRVAHTR